MVVSIALDGVEETMCNAQERGEPLITCITTFFISVGLALPQIQFRVFV